VPEGHTNPRSITSGKLVLVDKPTQHVPPADAEPSAGEKGTGKRIRRLQIEASMRPLGVVVSRMGSKDALQVAATENEHPVKASGPDHSHPPFGERVRLRGPDWRLDDVHSFEAEDLVEGTGVLRVPVSDQESNALKPLPHRELAGVLGHPCGVRVPGDAEDVHPPGRKLDGEQCVQGPEHEGCDSEEIERQDPLGLGPQELAPDWAATTRSRA
jgi:hypothetical protein